MKLPSATDRSAYVPQLNRPAGWPRPAVDEEPVEVTGKPRAAIDVPSHAEQAEIVQARRATLAQELALLRRIAVPDHEQIGVRYSLPGPRLDAVLFQAAARLEAGMRDEVADVRQGLAAVALLAAEDDMPKAAVLGARFAAYLRATSRGSTLDESLTAAEALARGVLVERLVEAILVEPSTWHLVAAGGGMTGEAEEVTLNAASVLARVPAARAAVLKDRAFRVDEDLLIDSVRAIAEAVDRDAPDPLAAALARGSALREVWRAAAVRAIEPARAAALAIRERSVRSFAEATRQRMLQLQASRKLDALTKAQVEDLEREAATELDSSPCVLFAVDAQEETAIRALAEAARLVEESDSNGRDLRPLDRVGHHLLNFLDSLCGRRPTGDRAEKEVHAARCAGEAARWAESDVPHRVGTIARHLAAPSLALAATAPAREAAAQVTAERHGRFEPKAVLDLVNEEELALRHEGVRVLEFDEGGRKVLRLSRAMGQALNELAAGSEESSTFVDKNARKRLEDSLRAAARHVGLDSSRIEVQMRGEGPKRRVAVVGLTLSRSEALAHRSQTSGGP